MKEHAGLYVHIPFCEKKCEYCDFYSITQLDQIESFVKALLKEIALRAPEFQNTVFHTIFLGGGHDGNDDCNGAFDDFRIYDRPLTLEEVQQLAVRPE